MQSILVAFERGNRYCLKFYDKVHVNEVQNVRIWERSMWSTKNNGQEEVIVFDLWDTMVIFDDHRNVEPSTDLYKQP